MGVPSGRVLQKPIDWRPGVSVPLRYGRLGSQAPGLTACR